MVASFSVWNLCLRHRRGRCRRGRCRRAAAAAAAAADVAAGASPATNVAAANATAANVTAAARCRPLPPLLPLPLLLKQRDLPLSNADGGSVLEYNLVIEDY